MLVIELGHSVYKQMHLPLRPGPSSQGKFTTYQVELPTLGEFGYGVWERVGFVEVPQ